MNAFTNNVGEKCVCETSTGTKYGHGTNVCNKCFQRTNVGRKIIMQKQSFLEISCHWNCNLFF